MMWINLSELKGDLKLLKGESLIFHCEVLEFSVCSSKNGNMYGILEVCNDCDQSKFFLFGEDLVSFKQHGVKEKQLLIKGSPKKQRFSDNYEFRIGEILDVF